MIGKYRIAGVVGFAGFAVGDRVKLSRLGLGTFLGSRHTPELRATVTGFGRSPDIIRVRLPGNKTVTSYHASFWEKANDKPEPR